MTQPIRDAASYPLLEGTKDSRREITRGDGRVVRQRVRAVDHRLALSRHCGSGDRSEEIASRSPRGHIAITRATEEVGGSAARCENSGGTTYRPALLLRGVPKPPQITPAKDMLRRLRRSRPASSKRLLGRS